MRERAHLNLGPRYRALTLLAKGGMGAILEGEDRKLGRTIAVKVMLDVRASDGQARRFVQEAAVLGKLAHPNIVNSLAWDKEGKSLVTACSDGKLRIWDAAKGG